jgi:hypothetical protein
MTTKKMEEGVSYKVLKAVDVHTEEAGRQRLKI